VNLEHVEYCHKPEIGRLEALEAELERIRRVKERLTKKEAKIVVKVLRLKKKLSGGL